MNSKKRKRRIFLKLLIIAVAAVWLSSSLFIVNETETAIVTRFSKPKQQISKPGLHLKLPYPFDAVIRFDKRLTLFDHEPTEFLTLDKKNILIDIFAVWKVEDEYKFLTTVRTLGNAEARMLDMITAITGEVVGKYPLKNFINTDSEEVKLTDIDNKIFAPCSDFAKNSFGIDIVDIRINSFNFPEQNRQSVIKRMKAERYRIATQYRSEGEEEALKLNAATDFEVRKILAEANKDAALLRGAAEAEQIRIYGETFSKDPKFFEFLRTLETYDKIADSNTTFIMNSNSRLWDLIERGAP
jgi:membrane protease subunit HflC